MITQEPAWLDGALCQFCQVKFNVTIRKHHCRHCGRVGCSTCLPKTSVFPIEKFGLSKPERLCGPCFKGKEIRLILSYLGNCVKIFTAPEGYSKTYSLNAKNPDQY